MKGCGNELLSYVVTDIIWFIVLAKRPTTFICYVADTISIIELNAVIREVRMSITKSEKRGLLECLAAER